MFSGGSKGNIGKKRFKALVEIWWHDETHKTIAQGISTSVFNMIIFPFLIVFDINYVKLIEITFPVASIINWINYLSCCIWILFFVRYLSCFSECLHFHSVDFLSLIINYSWLKFCLTFSHKSLTKPETLVNNTHAL